MITCELSHRLFQLSSITAKQALGKTLNANQGEFANHTSLTYKKRNHFRKSKDTKISFPHPIRPTLPPKLIDNQDWHTFFIFPGVPGCELCVLKIMCTGQINPWASHPAWCLKLRVGTEARLRIILHTITGFSQVLPTSISGTHGFYCIYPIVRYMKFFDTGSIPQQRLLSIWTFTYQTDVTSLDLYSLGQSKFI